MIISIFAVDPETNKKAFRSSNPLSSSKINYYITEFLAGDIFQEGIIQKDTYNYVYSTCGAYKIVIQASVDMPFSRCRSLIKHIEKNISQDPFDIIFVIDNVLYGYDGIKMDLQPIKAMDSQDEKIYNMMMENKMMEMKQREKEYRRDVEISHDPVVETRVPMEIKPKKVEKSSHSVLIVIKEKIKLELDKENYIKENVINGEINMVIYNQEFKQVQLKMKNLKGAIKFSPYLDKNALKKSILRFEKDRGINKSIPLLKWTDKCIGTPLSVDFWNDEEDGKYLNIFEFKAKKNLNDVEIKFSKENVSEIETEEEHEETQNFIVFKIGDLSKDESKTIEIKCLGFDSKCLFPVEVSFKGASIDSQIDVESVFLEDKTISDFEVRKSFEVESFVIKND